MSTSGFLDADVYEKPAEFDGARFLKLRQQGGKWESAASVVSTNSDHFVFGLGKYVCPGRFFAAAEVKTALAVILSNYDVRLHSEYEPKVLRYVFEILVDPEVRLEVRKRMSKDWCLTAQFSVQGLTPRPALVRTTSNNSLAHG